MSYGFEIRNETGAMMIDSTDEVFHVIDIIEVTIGTPGSIDYPGQVGEIMRVIPIGNQVAFFSNFLNTLRITIGSTSISWVWPGSGGHTASIMVLRASL
jgi:hypothetical protein